MESCWTTPVGAGFFPQMFYVEADGNSRSYNTASTLNMKPRRPSDENFHKKHAKHRAAINMSLQLKQGLLNINAVDK